MIKKYKILSFATIGLLITIATTSCKKYEDVPVDVLGQDYAYDGADSNGTALGQRIVSLYATIPNGFNRIDGLPLDAATDDAVGTAVNSSLEQLSKSYLTPTINPDDNWGGAYNAIRNVNNYLQFEQTVPASVLIKTYFRAEARFIRALHYFEMIKRYGGVPLIGDRIYNGYEIIDVPRNTYAECVEYIVKECDEIAGFLRPNDYTANGVLTGSNIGRISKSAALALKARVLLYAASPLNNATNDVAKWNLAALAARDVIAQSPNIRLYNTGGALAFPTMFITRANNFEFILAYQNAASTGLENLNGPIGFALPNVSRGAVSPSQNLVDAFPALNGRAITDPASGYNPLMPYANRDPRLGFTVFFNGSRWLTRAVETFEGGLDNPVLYTGRTRTGYYQRKFLGLFENVNSYAVQQRTFPIFRYAEVLLNYAEALNEAGTGANQTEAFNQIKAIRLRAGIPIGTTAGFQHGLKTNMTQSELRIAIRNERRIEMAFEEQRFWDIRRWKIADVVGNSVVNGVKILKDATGNFTYQTTVVDQLNFNPAKNYLYPIPLNEIISNPSMNGQQNPGY